jgi:hypothetical protein
MGTFDMALSKGRFSGPGNAPLAKSSVNSTLNLVAATFRKNGKGMTQNKTQNITLHDFYSGN